MGPYTFDHAKNVGGHLGQIKQMRIGEFALILGYAAYMQKGQAILELASGGGRIMNDLAEYGYDVYGIEMSAAMIDGYAKPDRAWRRPEVQRRIHYIQGDMTNFALKRKFGLIIIPYHSFWYNLDEQGAKNCIWCVVNHLAPDGIFLIDSPFLNRKYERFYQIDRTGWWESMAADYNFVFHGREYYTNFRPHNKWDLPDLPDSVMLEGKVSSYASSLVSWEDDY